MNCTLNGTEVSKILLAVAVLPVSILTHSPHKHLLAPPSIALLCPEKWPGQPAFYCEGVFKLLLSGQCPCSSAAGNTAAPRGALHTAGATADKAGANTSLSHKAHRKIKTQTKKGEMFTGNKDASVQQEDTLARR